MSNPEADVGGLEDALQRLDRLIAQAVDAANASGLAPPGDAFRGLHIGPEDVRRWLAVPAGQSPGCRPIATAGREPIATAGREAIATLGPKDRVDLAGDGSRLAWLEQAFGLSRFDLDVLVIALAPEVDLRYEGLYAYLQDDVTRRRPAVELALALLCPTLAERVARRAHFAADGPLLGHHLLELAPSPGRPAAGLLSQAMQVDAQIADALLGQGGLDRRLAGFCRTLRPQHDPAFLPCLPAGMWEQLQSVVVAAMTSGRRLHLHLQGPRGSGRQRTAEALAARVGRPLLLVDLGRAVAGGSDLDEALRLACREAWLQASLLYIDLPDAWSDEARAGARRGLIERLGTQGGISIVAGTRPWVPEAGLPLGLTTVRFAAPDAPARQRCWETELARQDLLAEPGDVEALSSRFRLRPGQIRDAVLCCEHDLQAPDSSNDRRAVPRSRLLAEARRQCGHRLACLARRIEPVATWDDIVLSADALAQLRELCARALYDQRVFHDWGFGRKLSQGRGASALFAGSSGTGKTMAAEIVANELGLELYKVDLAGVVSKYIGETEKNLDAVFDAAADGNAILFFDEADALFGKRGEVRDSHDRYANLEVSYLLQRMEQYEGIAILATNLRQNLDEAFVRRLAFNVHFQFPDEADRSRIWRSIWPPALPLAGDIDFDRLAREFKLSGGHIKNIALAAAFLAAEADCPVSLAHVLHAARREYQKMGKEIATTELASASVVAIEGRRA